MAASGCNYSYMKPDTRRKFKRIAKHERRDLKDTYDVVADEALKLRGLDKSKRRSKP